MTVELSPLSAPSALVLMLAHLAPLGPCGLKRYDTSPPVFRQVNRIDGADDLYLFCDNAVLSVHTFAPTITAVHHEAERTHRRILLLATELIDIPLSSGGVANVDDLEVQQHPRLSDYRADNVFRMKAVYGLSVAFT